MIRKLAISVAILFGLATVSSARAATLNVVGGQLLGASGVNVGGTLYDVQFLDGTCAAVFSGCDNAATDFDFTTLAAATAAAQALLDQVLLDGPSGSFDTDPELQFGIEHEVFGVTIVPYAHNTAMGAITAAAVNRAGLTPDFTSTGAISPNFDLTPITTDVFAKFSPAQVSPVPVPAIFPIFAAVMGLFGFVCWRRRCRIAATA